MANKKIQIEDAPEPNQEDSKDLATATSSAPKIKKPTSKKNRPRPSTKTSAAKTKRQAKSKVSSKTGTVRKTAPLLPEVSLEIPPLSPDADMPATEQVETAPPEAVMVPTETSAPLPGLPDNDFPEIAPKAPSGIPASKISRLPKWRHPQWSIAAATGAVLLLTVGWGVCSIYRSQIVIGDTALSTRIDDTALAQALAKQVDSYKIILKHPDGTKHTFALQDAGFKLNTVDSVQATRQRQNELGQRLRWWQPTSAVLDYKVDNATLDKFIATAAHISVQPSQDATLSITDGRIIIKDAIAGKQYGLNKAKERFLAAARRLEPSPIKLHTLTINPALTARSLETYKPLLEKTLDQSINLSIGEKTYTPTPADIATWLEITPDHKTKKMDISVNSGKVQAYIDKKAAADIRPARAQVETTREDGTVQLLVAGSDGVDVPGKAAAASAIAKALLKGEGMTLSMPIRYDQFKTINTGLYPKWIEVDLTAKRMYSYELTNLIKTDLVTAGAPDTPTVTGQYAIYAKFGQQDMRGRNVDGSNYFQPRVRFVSYFYKDYAIHGNYWRPLSYFGNINSSHGCVSLPDTAAEWNYNWAPIGTPVIVHT